jgi:hypothetical protein
VLGKSTLAVLTALTFVAVQPALAQKTGPNGGLLAGKEGHQTELVVSAGELTVYILDHGKAHGTKGVKMRAVVQQTGKSTNIDLSSANGKKMVGKLPAPLAKGTIVVLTGKDDHGDVISSRYVID